MQIVFRKFPQGDVIALFCHSANDCRAGNVMSYMHVGQHGEASRSLGRNLAHAAPHEYAPLLAELRRIYGRGVEPVARLVANPTKASEREREARTEVIPGLTGAHVELIADHYLKAAIWADCPEGTNPRASRQAITRARALVRAFAEEYPDLVRAALACEGYGDSCAQDFGGERRHEWPYASFGHDLYLSSQGHGTGFFDRDALPQDLRERLQHVAYKYESRGKAWSVEPEFYRGWLYLR